MTTTLYPVIKSHNSSVCQILYKYNQVKYVGHFYKANLKALNNTSSIKYDAPVNGKLYNNRIIMYQTLTLKKVDYTNQVHLDDLFGLLQMYAVDPMGGSEAIDDTVLEGLGQALASRSYMHSFLVYQNDEPIAFANCIESFSTFSGKGLINIHDFAVAPQSRGQDVSQFLLSGIQDFAKSINCTKLTLEVLQGNEPAKRAYNKAGFAAYQLNPELGDAMFWHKYIS